MCKANDVMNLGVVKDRKLTAIHNWNRWRLQTCLNAPLREQSQHASNGSVGVYRCATDAGLVKATETESMIQSGTLPSLSGR